MWTTEQKKQFATNYVLTAKIYDKDLNLDVAKLVTDDLSDLKYEDCERALIAYRKNPMNRTWPKEADLRAIIQPSIDKRTVAIELAYKIDKCINKHGYTWAMGHMQNGVIVYRGAEKKDFPTWKAAVISEIGEVGYHAICSRGDWQKTCESANESEEQFFIAQMRDQIVSTITLREQGVDITQIEMPKANEQLSSPTKDLFAHLGLSTKEFPSIKKRILPIRNDQDH